jgi:hypothetical protein
MITAVLSCDLPSGTGRVPQTLLGEPLLRKILLAGAGEGEALPPRCEALAGDGPAAGRFWPDLLEKVSTPYLLSVTRPGVQPDPRAAGRLLQVAEATGAGMVYGDYAEEVAGTRRERPLIDCQLGSLREGFDFGPLVLLSVPAARRALREYGTGAAYRWAGWYDLRLKLATDHAPLHLPEPLALLPAESGGDGGLFAYVDPRNSAAQREMEAAATAHLRRLGAWLAPPGKEVARFTDPFPVEASVVIPVRNRLRTVAGAVQSALAQCTDFSCNVIVVDNHSDDGTTALLADLAAREPRLVHRVPERRDLTIGGCWNEAIYSPRCGRYAIQLDSDDLYATPASVQRLVDLLRSERCAMAVGAYTLVNERLEEIPPGLVDHREWTEANGHNNALRVNGLGAPRAFATALLRRIGFPNVGYGEDYAVALRLSREFRIGRIFESLYLCRRWAGNTDAALSVEAMNRHDHYKDRLRTIEILARRQMNGER